jgi:hypothetical protein
VLEEFHRSGRHGAARVLDHELRHSRRDRVLDDEPGRTRVDRAIRELVSVEARPAHAEEKRARRHGSRVVREIRDLDGGIPDDLARGQRFCDA